MGVHDSPQAIVVMQIKETVELFLQNGAFYSYAGSQNSFIKWINSGDWDSDKTVILAERIEYVSLFGYVLSIDFILMGILWNLYIVKHTTFHGTFYRYLVFTIDFIFDVFYAIFPLILIGKNNINFMIAAASVNTESSFIIFVSALLPILYITFKLFTIFKLLSRYASKLFDRQFRATKYSPGSKFSMRSISVSNVSPQAQQLQHETVNSFSMVMSAPEMSPPLPLQIASTLNNMEGNLKDAKTHKNVNEDINPNDDSEGNCKGEYLFVVQMLVRSCALFLHCNICCFGDKYINNKKNGKIQKNGNYDTGNDDDNENITENENDIDNFIVENCRKFWTILLAMISIVYGMALIIQMTVHITDRINICDDYNINLLNPQYNNSNQIVFDPKYAQLYVWELCAFKVYPISDDIPCQCRNLIVTDENTVSLFEKLNNSEYDITMVANAIFKKFYMLETLNFDAILLDIGFITINLTSDAAVARNLRILQLFGVTLGSIDEDLGKFWPNLVFVKFRKVISQQSLDLISWKHMKHLKLFDTELTLLDIIDVDFLCELKYLREIGYVGGLDHNLGVPSCFKNLQQLQFLSVLFASSISADLLFAPKLEEIYFFRNTFNASKFENNLINYVEDKYGDIFDVEWLNGLSGRRISLQASDMCSNYLNNYESFVSEFELTAKLINFTQACQQPCDTDEDNLVCQQAWWHNGM